MKFIKIIFFFAAVLIVQPTLSQHIRKLSKQDLASMYSEFSFTSFQSAVYHKNDTLSTVYLGVSPDDFSFLPDTLNGPLTARIGVFYELFKDWNAKLPYDTGSIVVTDTSSIGKSLEMIINLDVAISYPSEQILIVTLMDKNNEDKRVSKIIPIQKQNRYSRQNYHLLDESGFSIFGNALSKNQFFRFEYPDTNLSKVYIRYYDQSFPLAKPPFVYNKEETYKFEPDSFFTINLTQGLSPLLELPYDGIYHFQVDLNQPEGLTLFHFDEVFPAVTSPEQALKPLRYLSTQKEFDQLIAYKEYKTAVDSFWLVRASKKPERAKSMIKKYYSRVETSNIEFSSYHEGWKTDRGLIYIIYGPPSEVYRKENEEEWIYGERRNPMSIRFYFQKAENPFSDNDYRLQRSPSYKSSWYISIENWRR